MFKSVGRKRCFVAERQFRLPGSPYEDLVNTIVAYGTRDEASRPGDLGKLDSVHQSSVSRTNGFLTEIGVLQGETKKLITPRGRSLALALARKDRGGIRANWREVVASTEFLQNVVSAVKLREGMLFPTVQAYVAHAAGQPRNNPVMTGAGAIVEILKTAGLLREEAGELVAVFDEDPRTQEFGHDEPEQDTPVETSPNEAPGGLPAGSELADSAGEAVSTVVGVEATGGEGAPSVQIHLHVSCAPDEIEDLVPRLKALLRELSDQRAP